jgi:hypothetical protein
MVRRCMASVLASQKFGLSARRSNCAFLQQAINSIRPKSPAEVRTFNIPRKVVQDHPLSVSIMSSKLLLTHHAYIVAR